jgi:hypothetical protein
VRFHSIESSKTPGGLRAFFRRMLGRNEVTAFHRCLAVHMYFAAQR